MSYLALARKWRPRRFADLVGQGHCHRALQNALTGDRLHHAYLFTGTRGVGKTTIARIFAKALNCDTGVAAEPCGTCPSCQEMDGGRCPDLIEIDAASRTRVDETRELLDNVPYAPLRGRYKIYLIDEVHMFSSHSFNALLKTLEEPPAHVKFLLATTEPKRLPVTILSRCLRFDLQRLTRSQIETHLRGIVAAEGVTAEPLALRYLAEAADGSVRDALSLLDQALAFGAGTVRAEDLAALLGRAGRGQIQAVIEALVDGEPAAVLGAARALHAGTPDYGAALAEVLAGLQRLAVLQCLPGAAGEEEDDAWLVPLTARLTPEDCQLYYQLGLMGRRDLPYAPDPAAGFEMALLRMAVFRPGAAAGPELDTGARTDRAAVPPAAALAPATPAAAAPTATAPPAVARATITPAQATARPEPAEGPPPASPPRPPIAPPAAPLIAHDERSPPPAAYDERSPPPDTWAMADEPPPYRAPPPGPGINPPGNATETPPSPPSPRSPPAAPAPVPAPPPVSAPVSAPAPVSVPHTSSGSPFAAPGEQTAQTMATGAAPTAGATSQDWAATVRTLRLRGPTTLQLAMHCVLLQDQGTRLVLGLAARHQLLNTPLRRQQLEEALAAQRKAPIALEIQVLTEIDAETPQGAADRAIEERDRAAAARIQAEPAVQTALRELGGEVVRTWPLTPNAAPEEDPL